MISLKLLVVIVDVRYLDKFKVSAGTQNDNT